MGSTVAVVIFRVLFCFKFGGLWIDGGREIFFSGFFFFFEVASSTVSSCSV